MSWAKFFEDNERITTERKFEREITAPNVRKIIHYDCYYCNKSFQSSENRNNHIREKHNVVGPLLFINGKISSSSTDNYVDEINSAKIILCGFKEVKIFFNQEVIKYASEEIDLMPYFKKHLKCYIIYIANKNYVIKKYDSQNISSQFVNEIINNWEKQITENETILLSNEYPSTLNEAEKRYLNGFYDYFTACKTSDEINKKKRYEGASAILSSFNLLPPKGIVLLKIISFRFNWIEKLGHLSKETTGSSFDKIVDFFHGEKGKLTEPMSKTENEQQFFVEDEISECLNAIMAYQNGDFDVVDGFLKKWSVENFSKIKDINKRDRILFLKIRRLSTLKRNLEAIECYKQLKTPLLKVEAKKFIL